MADFQPPPPPVDLDEAQLVQFDDDEGSSGSDSDDGEEAKGYSIGLRNVNVDDIKNRPMFVRNRQFLVVQKDFRPIEEETNILVEMLNEPDLSHDDKVRRGLEILKKIKDQRISATGADAAITGMFAETNASEKGFKLGLIFEGFWTVFYSFLYPSKRRSDGETRKKTVHGVALKLMGVTRAMNALKNMSRTHQMSENFEEMRAIIDKVKDDDFERLVTQSEKDSVQRFDVLQLVLRCNGFRDMEHFTETRREFPRGSKPAEFGQYGSGYTLYFHFLSWFTRFILVALLLSIYPMFYYGTHRFFEDGSGAYIQSYGENTTTPAQNQSPAEAYPMVKWYLLTPGNLGQQVPEIADQIPWYFITTACICLVLLFFGPHFSHHQHKVIDEVDVSMVLPDDFAVMVGDLPEDITEKELFDFFSKQDNIGLQQYYIDHAIQSEKADSSDSDTPREINSEADIDTVLSPKGLNRVGSIRKSHTHLLTDDPEHAVPIVQVIVCYEVGEFQKTMKSLKKDHHDFRRKIINQARGEKAIKDMNLLKSKINQKLEKCKKLVENMKCTGKALVVFEQQEHQRACLHMWGQADAWWKRVAHRIGRCIGVSQVKDLPHIRPRHSISVERAANPGDIEWKCLGARWQAVMYREFISWSVIMAVLVGCFIACYVVADMQKDQDRWVYNAETDTNEPPKLLVYGFTLVVLGSQTLAQTLPALISQFEFHNTKSARESSVMMKMSLGMVICVSAVPVFVKMKPFEWYTSDGLVSSMVIALTVAQFVPVFQGFVDAGFLWNRYAPKIGAKSIEKQARRKGEADASVKDYMHQCLSSEFDFPDRYSKAIRNICNSCILCPLFPMGTFFCVLSLWGQYSVDHFMMRRHWRAPHSLRGPDLASDALALTIAILLVCMPASIWFFLRPTFEGCKSGVECSYLFTISSHNFVPMCCAQDYVMLVVQIVCLVFWLLPLQIERIICRTNIFTDEEAETCTKTTYWTAQYLWKLCYHTQAPFYNVYMGSTEFLHRPEPGVVNTDSMSAKLSQLRKLKTEMDKASKRASQGVKVESMTSNKYKKETSVKAIKEGVPKMGWVFQTKADIKKHVLSALDYQFGNLDETYKDVRETFEMNMGLEFSEVDENGDGVIDKHELKKAITRKLEMQNSNNNEESFLSGS